MLFRQSLITLTVAISLVGCESAPKVDDTPEIYTSVATASVSNFGFKGFFSTAGTETVWTNAEMQRQDNRFKYTGDILSVVGKKQDRSNITRLDKNLVWQMDNRKKRYTECKLTGCGDLGSFDQNTFAGSDEELEDDESQCNIKLSKLDLSVKKSGQSRVINDFPTEEYVMNWVIEFQDEQKRKTTNVITSTVWTTPGDGGEAIKMQKDFADTQAQMMAAEAGILGPLVGVIPVAAMASMQRFLIDEMPEDIQRKIEQLAKKQKPINGFPISTKLEWNAKAEACGEAEKAAREKEEEQLDTSSVGGLLASVGKQVLKQKAKKVEDAKKKEIAMAPVYGYVKEVTGINMQNVRLSKMQVPSNYKLRNRK